LEEAERLFCKLECGSEEKEREENAEGEYLKTGF
jgi:hypothetical protein